MGRGRGRDIFEDNMDRLSKTMGNLIRIAGNSVQTRTECLPSKNVKLDAIQSRY
jgi:hypothetical protein